jgi:hypothetical protein
VAVLASALVAGAGQAPQATDEKKVLHRKGKPLSQLIPSGAQSVVVEKDQSPPHYVEPPRGTSRLEWLTTLAPIVLVVRVETMDPALTADEDWITTSVTGRVEEILKKPAADPLSVGAAIRFVQDGGEANVRGTSVRAVLPWADSFREGERYLVFAKHADDKWLIDAGTSYLIDSGDMLKPLARQGRAASEASVSLAAAAARIRQYVGRDSPWPP